MRVTAFPQIGWHVEATGVALASPSVGIVLWVETANTAIALNVLTRLGDLLGEAANEVRPGAEGWRASEVGDPESIGEFSVLDVDLVKGLDVIADKADWHEQDSAATSVGEPREHVGCGGGEPLDGSESTLPTEMPGFRPLERINDPSDRLADLFGVGVAASNKGEG